LLSTIEFRNVTLALDSSHLLFRDFSLRLSSCTDGRGKIIAIMGESGIGKSTLLKVIADVAMRNEVVLSGQAIVSNQSGVVYLPQKPVFVEDKSVQFNLTLLDGIGYSDVHRVKEKRGQFCRLLGIESLLGRTRISELSGGERQRVMLARTMAFSPEVLLLDEPVTSLDPNVRAHLLWNLRTIVDEERILCIYVTHTASEALAYADEIVFLSSLEDGLVSGYNEAKSTFQFFARPPTIAAAAFLGAPFWSSLPADAVSKTTTTLYSNCSLVAVDGKKAKLADDGGLKGRVSFRTPGALAVQFSANSDSNLMLDGVDQRFGSVRPGDEVGLDLHSAVLQYDANGMLIQEG
jgi:iron(III) transport system ATP-binding protein